MPKVSVIIPAYNCAKFVDGTIISVLKQDFSDYEMVIIDDGSTDNTYEAISRFSDRRIKYIHQINQGVGAARNTGIQKSNGEYLCFLDCDDIFLANSISKRVAFLDKYKEVMLVFSDHSREYDKGYPISNYLRKYDFVNFCKDEIVKSDANEIIFNPVFYRKFLTFPIWAIHTSTMMLRRSVFSEIGLVSGGIQECQELEMCLRVMKKYNIGFINEQLSKYVKYRSTLTRNFENCYTEGIKFRSYLLQAYLKEETLIDKNSNLINILRNKLRKDYYELGAWYIRRFQPIRALNCFLKSKIA